MLRHLSCPSQHRVRLVMALLCGLAPAASAAGEIAGPPTSDDLHYPKAENAFVNLKFPKGETKAWHGALVTGDDPVAVAKWYWARLGLGDPVEKNSTTGLKTGVKTHEQKPLKQTLTQTDWNFSRKPGEKTTRVFQAVLHESGGKRGDFVFSLTLHHREELGKTEILLSFIPTK